MAFFDRFFGKEKIENNPKIHFGRYSDIYKEAERYEAWDRSLSLYEEGKYLEAYNAFFQYLGDTKEGNVLYEVQGKKIIFQCFQGSKKVTGEANRVHLKAEAKIAATGGLKDPSFLRDLLERNFELEYCRFGLDTDKNLTVIFDTSTLDGSPYKLYHALREIAIQADKQDDLLLDRYSSLQAINTGHTKDLPLEEKEVKYNFAISEIKNTLATIKKIQPKLRDYPGGIAYLLLSLCYKLDYLLVPQGHVTDVLERIHRTWFATDKQTTEEKNKTIIREFELLLKRPKESWFNEFYRVISTFGIVPAYGHERIQNIIEAELPVFDWYLEHGYTEVALAIGDYIVGHSQFSFALPKPDRDFLHLYYRITNSEFFQALKFNKCCFDTVKQRPLGKEIKKQIQKVVAQNSENYPSLQPDMNLLKFGNLADFVRSYLLLIKRLNPIKNR